MTDTQTLVGQLLATNNNLQEKAAVRLIEQSRRIAELEAALLAAHSHMQNAGHYQDDATMPLFKQIACALPRRTKPLLR